VTLARAVRWSLIIAPVLAGIALLIFGTAGGISTGFGITLIGIGAIVWLWNWFLRMAFDEEADKQAERDRERAERAQSSASDAPARPPHEHPPPRAPLPRPPHEHPRPTRRGPRRRPQ
jgi:hypothetical protein